jgi:hypothetical protein
VEHRASLFIGGTALNAIHLLDSLLQSEYIKVTQKAVDGIIDFKPTVCIHSILG